MSLFFSPFTSLLLQPLRSSDWSSLALIVREHVLCWSVKGRREPVTDVESNNAPPSVRQWLMFKEWSKNPWPIHLTARGTLLFPHMKVIFAEVWNNYYTLQCSSDVKWRSLYIWIKLIKHIIESYYSSPCHCNFDIWKKLAFSYYSLGSLYLYQSRSDVCPLVWLVQYTGCIPRYKLSRYHYKMFYNIYLH